MDFAVDNYLALSNILRPDLEAMLASESESAHWRRNFVRSSFALLEGYIYAIGQIAAVALKEPDPNLTANENKALNPDSKLSADTRFKHTLKAAYKRLELAPTPNFGGQEWEKARRLFSIRDALMHPRRPSDLEITETRWTEIRQDIIWLFEQAFKFMQVLEAKHVG